MDQEIKKKATEMLLSGATLMAEPCPYCSGVRVIKDGSALCIECGAAPRTAGSEKTVRGPASSRQDIIGILESKMLKLAKDLDAENDLSRQQDILRTIQSASEAIRMLSD